MYASVCDTNHNTDGKLLYLMSGRFGCKQFIVFLRGVFCGKMRPGGRSHNHGKGCTTFSILLRKLCAAVIFTLWIVHGMVSSTAYAQAYIATNAQPTAMLTKTPLFDHLVANGAATEAQPTPVVAYDGPENDLIISPNGDTQPGLLGNQAGSAVNINEPALSGTATVEVQGNPSPTADTGAQAEGISLYVCTCSTTFSPPKPSQAGVYICLIRLKSEPAGK